MPHEIITDVTRYEKLRGTFSADYLALSYVWAANTSETKKEAGLQLLSHNTDLLSSANALDRYKSDLPKVILDAMDLTSAIGKRYLWVDRLCIVQDSTEKELEFSSMDRVYSGAYMTIIAAAEHGMFLTPFETIYSPPVESSWVFCLMPESESGTCSEKAEAARQSREIRIQCYYKTVSESKWAKRAWTYQEYILSKRVVFFLGTRIFWQCECSVWDLQHLSLEREDKGSYTSLSRLTLMNQLSVPTWPDFSIYSDLVCPYNGRELSYKSDGLSACLGILNYLAPAFPKGFLFGLPTIYLDHALLWQPLKGDYNSTHPHGWHTDGRQEKTCLSTRRPTLPSWAWCGWQCFIDPESFQAVLNLDQNGHHKNGSVTSWKLQKTVAWQYATLPEDPTKRESSLSNHISAQVARALFFPVSTLEICFHPWALQIAGFLHVSANPTLTHKPLSDMPKVVVLRDTAGKFSGLLRITGSSTCTPGEPIELIAISQGSAKGKDLQKSFEEKVLRRSRYGNPEPFHAKYDHAERWVNTGDALSGADTENYRVITAGEYEESLKLREYKDDQDYHFHNVLWVQRGDKG
ncbi:heterokaryon incompatibility protein-domain-containing protein [Fusarium tricinctum]|uniref:Heterokaryon incompatibility protein-domain-containing protein n=1 Tax=Fusarium tricinctum TaxID=61284 RepID=A0A8K0WC13_9HYPO|nr:heterokaryon incompatibility protein-domain-containing protein [Fusarium tricinctum]